MCLMIAAKYQIYRLLFVRCNSSCLWYLWFTELMCWFYTMGHRIYNWPLGEFVLRTLFGHNIMMTLSNYHILMYLNDLFFRFHIYIDYSLISTRPMYRTQIKMSHHAVSRITEWVWVFSLRQAERSMAHTRTQHPFWLAPHNCYFPYEMSYSEWVGLTSYHCLYYVCCLQSEYPFFNTNYRGLLTKYNTLSGKA